MPNFRRHTLASAAAVRVFVLLSGCASPTENELASDERRTPIAGGQIANKYKSSVLLDVAFPTGPSTCSGALIGPQAAMACTAAVETEIDRHYSRQLEKLAQDRGTAEDDPELADMIERFREDERAHHDAAIAPSNRPARLAQSNRSRQSV